MKYTSKGMTLTLFRETGSVRLMDAAGYVWMEQYPAQSGFEIIRAEVLPDGIGFTILDPGNHLEITCRYRLEPEKNQLVLTMAAEGAMAEPVNYPPSYRSEAGELVLYPFMEGMTFLAEDTQMKLPPWPILLAGGGYFSMSFLGKVMPNQKWLLCAPITSHEGKLVSSWENGLYRGDLSWIDQKGQWGYTREVRYLWGETDGVTGLCRAYRKIAEEKGFCVTLREKAAQVNKVDRVVGSANFWVWNDDAMDLLYSENTPYSIPTEEQKQKRIEVAKDMVSCGITDVLWSIFNENLDKNLIDQVKNLGYLTTFYDIYTDVIPGPIFDLIPTTRQKRCLHRLSCWPEGIVKLADGTASGAWQLKCTDGVFRNQERICEVAALDCASKVIPQRKEEYGLDGTFLDVTGGPGVECYDTRHPMTRTECVEYKRKLMRLVSDHDMISATEVGFEDLVPTMVYNEGMSSPTIYRAPDAGRRMTHLYYGKNVPESITHYMLNPKYRAPLWELVFHDCVQSYWYWGDSHNCCPELMDQRDRFCMLYGQPPLFSFNVGNWEKLKDRITASYHKTVSLAKKVGYATMDRFDYLTEDRMVQQTTFSDGTVVTVNFSDEVYTDSIVTLLPGETKIQ